MQRIRLFLLSILLSLPSTSMAAVFIVTSNADSGPGTFRDALTQAAANGSAQQDFINFNITDLTEAGRTITILSALPGVSSNLVIDGSTQPGSAFGVSDAKVSLAFNSTGQNKFEALTIQNQADVAIYGLYLNLTNTFKFPAIPIGIHATNTNNLQLGDVGKGNVIAGFLYPLEENDSQGSESTGLVLKSNFFSIQADGLTVTGDAYATVYNVYGNITIGGASIAEGNLFAKGIFVNFSNPAQFAAVLFKNNKSGVNYNLTAVFQNATVTFGAGQNTPDVNTAITVEDNIICSSGQANSAVAIYFTRVGAAVNMVRNYVNVDKNQKQIGDASGRVYVQQCKEVHIGSNNVADANYVGYAIPVFDENSGVPGFVGTLSVTKNSFFCTANNTIYFSDDGGQRTICYITQITANSVTGTATPNAEVELYYSDICNTCAPQHYFASVTSDASGNWVYNGAISGIVIANATYNNSSSEFTEPQIIDDNVKITNACGGAGSITGIVVHNVTETKWLDQKGNVAGTDIDLINVIGGNYRLAVSNGGCADTSGYYTILSKFDLDTSKVIVKNPVCGDSLGYVTGLNPINPDKGQITYAWTDAGGKLWSDSVTLKNVPAGTYSLVAISSDTCTQTYGPVLMPDQNDILVPPSVNSIKLCLPADAVIRVLDTSPGYSYRLYQSAASSTPIDQQTTGIFNIKATKSTSYYVSRFYHNCESARTLVQVDISGNLPDIANTFTPNGDGVNDYWKINNIEDSPSAVVQVFNRYGQLVYHSIGYAVPFKGTYNGKALPAGVYYYTIGLSAGCKLISGSLTIIR